MQIDVNLMLLSVVFGDRKNLLSDYLMIAEIFLSLFY